MKALNVKLFTKWMQYIIPTAFFNPTSNTVNLQLSEIEYLISQFYPNTLINNKLYLKAIAFLEKGKTSNIKQSDISKGTTYYNKQWRLKQKIKLVLNFRTLRKSYVSGTAKELQKKIKTVKLNIR